MQKEIRISSSSLDGGQLEGSFVGDGNGQGEELGRLLSPCPGPPPILTIWAAEGENKDGQPNMGWQLFEREHS